jgi:CheY-like chemotaxis protein
MENMLPKRTNILIVDSDLGSVFWLGQALDLAGCESLPAKSLSDAKALLDELKVTVDLLIVRSSMPGAAAFAETLRRTQGRLKMIGLVGDNEESFELEPQMDAWLQKPFLTHETAKCDYLELIRLVLADDDTVPCNVVKGIGQPFLDLN